MQGEVHEAIVVTVSRNDGALNYGGSSWDGASYPVRLWEFLKDVKFKAMSLTLVMGAIDCRLPPTPTSHQHLFTSFKQTPAFD